MNKRHYARFEEEEDDGEEDEGVRRAVSSSPALHAADVAAAAASGSGQVSPASGQTPTRQLSSSSVNGKVTPSGSASHSPHGPLPTVIGANAEIELEVTKPPLQDDDFAASPMEAGKTKVPVEVVKEKRLASNPKTFINSLTCFIGAATYTLPACFQNIGLVGGVVMLAFSAAISLHCMFLLVDCRNHMETVHNKRIKTYGDLGYYAFGILGARMVDAFIMLTQFGFCVCYFIVVSQTVHQMFPEAVSKNLCIYLMMPLLVRVSWLKSLRSLASVSLVAETGMFLSLGMVSFYIIHRLVYGAWDMNGSVKPHNDQALGSATNSDPLVLFNVLGLTNFFGVSICVFEGVGMVLPVYNSMQHPKAFKAIWASTMGLVTGIYMFFGAFGYMAYRTAHPIEDIILANLPHIPLTIVVKTCFCFGLYLTYPLMLFPVIEIWEEMAGRTAYDGATWKQTLGWNSARSTLVILTGILAMFIPKLNLFIALIGASGSTALAFVLPASFKLKLRWSDMTALERIREACCMIIGITGGTISTIAAVRDLREAYVQDVELEADGAGGA